MSRTGTIERIHIASESGRRPESTSEIDAVAGRGLRGDRHFGGDSFDLTLIEAEALDAVADDGLSLADGSHRRNVTTRGVALNHLVGKRFRVGETLCRGVELCEPCSHLESLTERGVVSAFTHRGGLSAEILESGTIRTGDEITPV